MTPEITKKLNQINQDFYKITEKDFDNSRNHHWPGWDELLKFLPKSNFNILDIGCGNGRFGLFVKEKFKNTQYVGIDSNDFLLKKASESIIDGKFYNRDIVADKWDFSNNQFDVITIFGVMHHIPGYDNRASLLTKARQKMKTGGILVITVWEFIKTKRLKTKKVIDPETITGKKIFEDLEITKEQLDENDYILDWQKGDVAYRYGHIYTKDEIIELSDKTGFSLIAQYSNDGKELNVNTYYILKAV